MRLACLAIVLLGCGAGSRPAPHASMLSNRAGPPLHRAPAAAAGPVVPRVTDPELTPHRIGPPISAASLLTEDMVRAVAGYQGGLVAKTMADPSAQYEDVHYQATNEPEEYDAALRVWVEDATAANTRFDQLHSDLPTPVDVGGLGDRAMTSGDGQIFGVVFVDNRGLVVMLTCGKAQCHTPADALALVRRVRARVPARW